MRFEVWYNVSKDPVGRMDTFWLGSRGVPLDGHDYSFVGAFDAEYMLGVDPGGTPVSVLSEKVFRKFNAVTDADVLTLGLDCRSMSVGDVVVFQTELGRPLPLVCRNGGFEPVNFPYTKAYETKVTVPGKRMRKQANDGALVEVT